uniref:Secreted protein n=1 Tax=Meloidogyne floridensis TaxID=298350 RepID=A0A915NYH7_9BILA
MTKTIKFVLASQILFLIVCNVSFVKYSNAMHEIQHKKPKPDSVQTPPNNNNGSNGHHKKPKLDTDQTLTNDTDDSIDQHEIIIPELYVNGQAVDNPDDDGRALDVANEAPPL